MIRLKIKEINQHYFVDCKVNNKSVLLLVDTGTNHNVISMDIVSGINGNKIFKSKFNESEKIMKATIPDKITISGNNFENIYFLIQNRRFIVGDGILGSHFMQKSTLSFDFNERDLKIFSKTILNKGIKILVIDGIACVEMEILSSKGYFIIDTGCFADVLLYNKTVNLSNPVQFWIKQSSGKYSFAIRSIFECNAKIKGCALNKVLCYSSDKKPYNLGKIEIIGTIGVGILRVHGFTIDYISKLMEFNTL